MKDQVQEEFNIDLLTPKEIVAQLNRFIVGQVDAKKAMARALRDRWRRMRVSSNLKDEIIPKNILMVGPTGVGKTEIARRIAKLIGAPFIKVEATKFTEVGYVGRDVDSIIRDLVENAINMLKNNQHKKLKQQVEARAIERILDVLVGENASDETKIKFRDKIISGDYDDKEIEIEVVDNPSPSMSNFDFPGGQMGVINVGDMISKVLGGNKTKLKKMTIKQAMETLSNEEVDKLIDDEKLNKEAVKLVENEGIVFIDEIDKIAARSEAKGAEVSREGVQRDLLPLIEGTTVTTKYGQVKTDHILFIASGAFHLAKPSDLLPELQGRLPIRVELKPLSEEDLERILIEPEANLIVQYKAMIATEGLNIDFSNDAIKMIASIAAEANREVENIGARRLHTIIEKLLEDISFEAPEKKGEKIIIDIAYVNEHLSELIKKADLSKFIL